ncbi:MAG: ATP phosphoribosyltransferase [Cyclobacteriaceae bacterium]
MLRLAVQKKGRLSDSSLNLIRECGINFSKKPASLKEAAYNFPLEFLYLRDDDIPGYVADGTADIGIVGENVLVEKGGEVQEVMKLGFSKCRLSIGVPNAFDYKGKQNIDGMSIATSYPKILQTYLDENNLKAEIHEISGSVEIAPSIGLADGVCDIVSTGSTLISNGLKEVEKIFTSQAVLVASTGLSVEKQQILDDLVFRIKSYQRAKSSKYITLNAPNNSIDKIISLLPGVKSPSIIPLAQGDWSSIHSVVKEDDFWTVIEKVREAGAEGILVLPIEKIIQ